MCWEHTDEKHQIWACYLIIWPIACTEFVWPCNGNAHDWETWASHVYLGSIQAVVLACPVGPWPTALANISGISQPATPKGEGGEKRVKTYGGESMLRTWTKQNVPILLLPRKVEAVLIFQKRSESNQLIHVNCCHRYVVKSTSVSPENLLCGVESRHTEFELRAPISLSGMGAGSLGMGRLISLSLTNGWWMTLQIWGPKTRSVNADSMFLQLFTGLNLAQGESALERTLKFCRGAKPAPGGLIVMCVLSRCVVIFWG